MKNKAHIINLFNAGKLGVRASHFYTTQGFAIIISGGVVVDIVEDNL